MTKDLDLADIQGNILQDFVSGYPAARFIFLRVTDAAQARQFLLAYRAKVTTALRWSSNGGYAGPALASKPEVAVNIAFTYEGFQALELPTRTLARMPPEFMDGMKTRAEILGDDVPKNEQSNWDPVWARRPHILIGLNAAIDPGSGKPVYALNRETAELLALCAKYKLEVMSGHRNANPDWQDGSAILIQNRATYRPVPLEHFGFVDGISNPVFEGQFGDPHVEDIMAVGAGKILPSGQWAPLATGEFLLGHPDEAQELAPSTHPPEVMRNGTFLVYRKLHENTKSFDDYVAKVAKDYAAIKNVPEADAVEIVKAKMAGRWSNGVPLSVAPTIEEWRAFAPAPPDSGPDFRYVDFKYADDPEGIKCPVTSHTRRTNPRDGLVRNNPSSVLNNRRRILRRGVPYGSSSDASDREDSKEHGIIFLALCASLTRQFEFVQQQWLNYGFDANAGNDTCPLLGNREGDAKFLIPADPASGEAPFICNDIPQFVEVRGGDYFFLPSMTALRMIAMGVVDPT